MTKSSRTIVSVGIVTVIFMAIMSAMYLQHVPNKADLRLLEGELRDDFALVLSPSAPLKLVLVQPEREGRRMGITVVCTMRKTLLTKPDAVGDHLNEIADRILKHKRWRGKVDVVTVSHTEPLAIARTVRAPIRP